MLIKTTKNKISTLLKCKNFVSMLNLLDLSSFLKYRLGQTQGFYIPRESACSPKTKVTKGKIGN